MTNKLLTDLNLALLYMPRPQRFAVADLFALDAAMGDVLRTTTEPMIARIRLAWWRERLEEIDQGLVPNQPNLIAVARIRADYGIAGSALAQLADLWTLLLEPFPWGDAVIGSIADRGALLFGFASSILGAGKEGTEQAERAGSLGAMVDVAKSCSDQNSRDALIAAARKRSEGLRGNVIAQDVRPLTMLGLLAARDAKRWPEVDIEAAPARAWAMVRHRLTGRL